MNKKTVTRFPTDEEIKDMADKWASSIAVGDVSSWTTTLSDAYIDGAKWAINESLKDRDARIRPYRVLKDLDVGKSVTFPQYCWAAARTAASKLKADFGAVYTVKKIPYEPTYEKFCIATRIK